MKLDDDSFPISWMDQRHEWDIKYTVNVDNLNHRFTLTIDNLPFDKLPRAGHRQSKPAEQFIDSDDEDEKIDEEIIEQRRRDMVQIEEDAKLR